MKDMILFLRKKYHVPSLLLPVSISQSPDCAMGPRGMNVLSLYSLFSPLSRGMTSHIIRGYPPSPIRLIKHGANL